MITITDTTITPIIENIETANVETANVETAIVETAVVETTKPKAKKAYTMINASEYSTMKTIITKKENTLKSLHEMISVIYFDATETLDLKGSSISRQNGVYVIELDEYKGRSIALNLESDLTMNLKINKSENAKELSGKYYLQSLALTTAMLRSVRPLTDKRSFTVNVKGDVDIKVSYQSRPEHIALQIASLIGKNDLEIAVIFNALLTSVGIETDLALDEKITLKTIKNALDYCKIG